jgi:Zn-dependent M28 family amino/carboxypeptidase
MRRNTLTLAALLALMALMALPLLVGAAAGLPRPLQDAAPRISAERVRAHLAFLADDLLEGRAPGSRGGELAARYIATQLALTGVEPLRGGYQQRVPLLGWTADPRRVTVEADAAGRRATLSFPQETVLWLDSGADSANVSGEVVFVGYGTRAAEYGWDDFKGRNLRGRILLVLAGDPPAPPGQPLAFDGPAMSYYGRWTYKVEEAVRQGAAAVLIIHTDAAAGYGWQVVETSFTGERLALPHDSMATSPLTVQGWISFDAARRMLATADLDLQELFVRAARRDFQPIATGLTARLRAAGTTRRFTSPNVMGLVPGSHATRRDEVVVYTAHYDGLGIGPPVDGDSIYNGAYDNASGVALLLEVAAAFAALPTRPERSVLFLFTTAEEAGMLGASWYVRRPAVPMSRTVAALNIDGANLWGETADISAVGLERSTLGDAFRQQAAALGLRAEVERAPAKGLFFRSDQFPFARAGVPALALDHGTDFRNRPSGWGWAVLSDYEAAHYHRPSDRYDPRFDLGGAVQQGRHAFLLGRHIANTPARPRWLPGGEIRPR